MSTETEPISHRRETPEWAEDVDKVAKWLYRFQAESQMVDMSALPDWMGFTDREKRWYLDAAERLMDTPGGRGGGRTEWTVEAAGLGTSGDLIRVVPSGSYNPSKWRPKKGDVLVLKAGR